MQDSPDRGFNHRVSSGRAVQLDGLRAIAMVAIAWDHWCPRSWPRLFPYEIFLFFFLVLTGFLITGSLLRERDRNDSQGIRWKRSALKNYQVRRGLRILAPYYAALALAWILQAPDVTGAQMVWYLLHLSNIHIALLGYWPSGTNHFWSLAMQQQFYLFWPFVIWFLPRRWLFPAIMAIAIAGPVTRYFYSDFESWIAWPNLMTWASLDYFGIGALLALGIHRGMSLESPALRWFAGFGFAAYVAIFGSHALGWPSFGLRAFQQTCLSISLCGVIAATTVGFSGILKSILEHPVLQGIGRLSYGFYLFHNLAPLLAGKLFWFLWDPYFGALPWEFMKIGIYAALTWALTLASWRWIEQPLQEVRSQFGAHRS